MQSLDYITKWTAVHQSGDFEAESITVHWWGEPSGHRRPGTFDGIARYLASDNDRDSSASFVVSGLEAKLACLVDLDHAAWHAGVWAGNHRSVGIECRPWDSRTPKAEVEAELDAVAYTVALIWHWRPKIKGQALKGHRDWRATACPGSYYPHLGDIRKRAMSIYPRVDPDRPGQLVGAPKPTTPKEFTVNADDEKKIRAIVEKAVDRRVGDVVPAPAHWQKAHPKDPNATWMHANVQTLQMEDLYRIRQEQAIVRAKVDAIAGKILTDAEIAAAVSKGLDDMVDSVDTTTVLNVTGQKA